MGAVQTISRVTLSVDQYHRLADAGVFGEDDRIELVEGEMIVMAPIGPAHAAKVNELAGLFFRTVADRAIVSIQNPVALPPGSELQPDLALLTPAAHKYRSRLPTSSDVLLLVEVADSSLAYDRDFKLPIYAAHGIVEVWLLDVASETLLVFRDPVDKVYTLTQTLRRDDSIAPFALPHDPIRLAELWG